MVTHVRRTVWAPSIFPTTPGYHEAITEWCTREKLDAHQILQRGFEILEHADGQLVAHFNVFERDPETGKPQLDVNEELITRRETKLVSSTPLV